MSTQKELKQRYAEILAADVWHNDQSMVDFCVKEAGYIVELENGDILAITKPRIQKDFCFGYSDSRYDTEDYDRANAMAAHASSSTDYFLAENLREIDNAIKLLENNGFEEYTDGFKTRRVVYRVGIPYSRQPENSKLKSLFTLPWHDERSQKYPELSVNDRLRVIEGYKAVRAAFEKRLNTYLKRYGLSKVNSWSYWRDE